jgi:hypothetical protein
MMFFVRERGLAGRKFVLPTAPAGGIGQHEQVQPGEEQQDDREQREEAQPEGKLFLPR